MARPRGADDRVARGDHQRVAGDPDLELPLRRERLLPRLGRRLRAAGLGGARSLRRRRRHWRRRRGQRDLRVDLVLSGAPDHRLHGLARPVEEKRVAHARERPGERERDVTLPAVGLVVGRLVGARRVEQHADREGEHAHDERMPGAPLAAGRASVVGLARALAGRRWRRGLLEGPRLLLRKRRERREGRPGRVGHQNWK